MDPLPLTSPDQSPIGLASPAYSQIIVRLPDVSGLECLPEEGYIEFKYKRDELRLRNGKLSAELTLLAVTEVECDEDAEPAEKTEDVVDKLFAAANKDSEDDGEEVG